CQRAFQTREPAAHRAIDHDIASIDHRAADDARIDALLHVDLATEALLQRDLDRFGLGCRNLARAAQRYLQHALGFALEFLEQRSDVGEHAHATIVDEQAEE